MCTFTCLPRKEGFQVHFNRDELLSRPPEISPQKQIKNEVAYFAPQDTESKGTWFFLNEKGVVGCLLNRYPQEIPPNKLSRGEILSDFFNSENLADGIKKAEVLSCDPYPAFQFFLFYPDRKYLNVSWQRREKDIDSGELSEPLFVTSSSIDTELVEKARREVFEGLDVISPEALIRLHASHFPNKEQGICMHRSGGATKSYLVAEVGKRLVLKYAAGNPCLSYQMKTYTF